MAAGFEYFTNTDPGAPVLNGAAGRLIAVLDWVLVAKGGWAKEFTGTNLAVYRSATGNRFRLRVDDTQLKFARLRAYRAMTNVNTGTNMFPNATQAVATGWGVGKAWTAGTAPRNYWGVRTNRYVALFVEQYTEAVDGAPYNYVCFFAFGDVPTLCEADAHATVLVGAETPNADNYFPYPIVSEMSVGDPRAGIGGTAVSVGVSGSPDGSVVSPAAALVGPWNIWSNDGEAQTRVAKSGRLVFGPLTFWTGDTAAGSVAGSIARARLPNIHFVAGGVPALPASNAPCIDREEFALGARQFKVLCDYNSVTSNRYAHGTLLEKTDTDGAL